MDHSKIDAKSQADIQVRGQINDFFTLFRIGTLLHRCGVRKRHGYSVRSLIESIFALSFVGKNFLRGIVINDNANIGKDAAYDAHHLPFLALCLLSRDGETASSAAHIKEIHPRLDVNQVKGSLSEFLFPSQRDQIDSQIIILGPRVNGMALGFSEIFLSMGMINHIHSYFLINHFVYNL